MIPAWGFHNDTVTLTDTDITSTGTVTFGSYWTDIGGGSGTEVLSGSNTFTVSVVADGGEAGGTITNTATLTGESDSVTVNGPIDSITLLPIYTFEFECCEGVDLSASDTQTVGADPGDGFEPGDFVTYTQGGWGAPPNGANPASQLAANFAAIYPSGIEVGIPGSGGFSMTFTSAAAVEAYLPAGGPPGALNADSLNPTSTSSRVFGGQVLALAPNVDFSTVGIKPGGLGSLTLHDTGTILDGLTVSQVLDAAETALGGGLPFGMTFSDLNSIVTRLNESFDNGQPTAWAQDHLSP